MARAAQSLETCAAQASAPATPAPRDQEPLPAMRAAVELRPAAHTERVGRTPRKAMSHAIAEPAPLPPAPAAPFAQGDDDIELIRASAVDLHPVIDNPLGPALGIAPARARPRLRLQGPRDIADAIEDQL
jgi:hypothetical protein